MRHWAGRGGFAATAMEKALLVNLEIVGGNLKKTGQMH